ncbi:MAG: hypothetical protein ACJ716_07420 [Marmoricola sp.]
MDVPYPGTSDHPRIRRNRHTVDKDASGFERYPSPGRVAWDAWGGDAGERWVGRLDL